MLKESIAHVVQRIVGQKGRGSGTSAPNASADFGRERQSGGKARPVFVTVMELFLMPVVLFAANVSNLYDEVLRNGIWVFSWAYVAVVYYLVRKYPKVQNGQQDAGAEGKGYYVLGWVVIAAMGIVFVVLLIIAFSSSRAFQGGLVRSVAEFCRIGSRDALEVFWFGGER